MSISFSGFLSCVPYVLTARSGENATPYPILMRGRHGIGKSSLVYQIAQNLGWNPKSEEIVCGDYAGGYDVVERRASQMTEGDLLGLPSRDPVMVNGMKATAFNPPKWLVQACTEPVVLFFDEVDRAVLEVRQGLFELCDSRKIAGHVLHPGTVIFAAMNGGVHKGASSYQVADLDPAEQDRYTVYDVDPTAEDWLTWASDKVHPIVWAFINSNHKHLEHIGDYEPGKTYPSRRSWERFSNVAASGNMLKGGEANPIAYNIAASFLGMEAAVAFQDFVKNFEDQVTPEDVLDNGEIGRTNDFTLTQHCALIEQMEQDEYFQSDLSSDQLSNLADYMVSITSEACMKLWALIAGHDTSNPQNLHGTTTSSGQMIAEFMAELLTAQFDSSKS